MTINGLSILELRYLIESAFLPARCKCTPTVVGAPSLTIEVYDENNSSIALKITGVDINSLNSSRAIAELIGGIRSDLKITQQRSLMRQHDVHNMG
jgi:hypothetical protein